MPDVDALRKQAEDIYKRLKTTDLDIQRFDKRPEPMPRFHTGSWKLDSMLGGGWPWGRLIELFGPASSGKTTLALHAVKEAQNEGHVCGYVDAEHSVDPLYAFEGIDVDKEALLFQQPKSGEQALKAAETMVDEGVDLVVVDSVAALVPQAELDGEIGDSHVGLLARLMSQTMRRLAGKVKDEDATVIFINQIRMKIGVQFGNPETTPGGKALKFYSSIRLRVSPSKHKKDGGETVGNKINARCVKNKTAPPFRKDKLMITYGIGLDRAYELAEKAEEIGAIKLKGSWYSIADETICQGRDALQSMIRENEASDPDGEYPDNLGLRDRLMTRVKAIANGDLDPTATIDGLDEVDE